MTNNSEFFINIKKLPPEGTKEFQDLVDWEIEKIKYGIRIGGVYISGWLYWHLNHWTIRKDVLDNYGNVERVAAKPDLRDNEWIRAEILERCKKEGKGYMEIGARQSGKSELEASYLSMNAIIYENSHNLIVCGNDNDISLLREKVDFGLKNLWEGINVGRIDKGWRLNQIRLGYTEKDGTPRVWSTIIIRNAKDGHDTEVPAGGSVKSLIMDEVGKYPFAAVYKAAEPAIKGRYGLRATPILVGTGGSFDKGKDAEFFFYNPDANNFLSIEDPETRKKTCLFLSGLYRDDCKKTVSLREYLKEKDGIDEPLVSDIKILVSDKEKAKAIIEKEREASKKNKDKTIYQKQIMYYPLTVDECFLTKDQNFFDTDVVKRHLLTLHSTGFYGTPVVFREEDGKIIHDFTDKKPLTSFDYDLEESDAPVMIYEFPVDNAPSGLYCAGVDSYRQTEAKHSKSIGTVYIFKRRHKILDDKFQYMFVASYAARPSDKEIWNYQAEYLIRFYNAKVLCENDELSFIQHMKSRGLAERYLYKEPDFFKPLVPNSTIRREYGISRTSSDVIDYLHSLLKRYITEDIVNKENGISVKGVTRILDPMLLEEIIKFKPDDSDYIDRIVAAELALALAFEMDMTHGIVTDINRYPTVKKKQSKSIFSNTNRIFSNRAKIWR